MSVDEWYNAVQHWLYYQDTLQKQLKSYKMISFDFFLKDESFVSKTLNEGHVELNKFPASKVKQMAKKLEFTIHSKTQKENVK